MLFGFFTPVQQQKQQQQTTDQPAPRGQMSTSLKAILAIADGESNLYFVTQRFLAAMYPPRSSRSLFVSVAAVRSLPSYIHSVNGRSRLMFRAE
jgi:hypothetical protein